MPCWDVSTPFTNSEPPPWVPSDWVDNLNGWSVECSNLYVLPTSKLRDFFCTPLIT